MKRGDLVTVAMPGDYGKPRPALVIQSDRFEDTGTVTVLLMSGTLVSAPLIRVTVEPTPENGLSNPSQVMVDKAMSMRRDKLGRAFGGCGRRSHALGNEIACRVLGPRLIAACREMGSRADVDKPTPAHCPFAQITV